MAQVRRRAPLGPARPRLKAHGPVESALRTAPRGATRPGYAGHGFGRARACGACPQSAIQPMAGSRHTPCTPAATHVTSKAELRQ